MKVVIDRDGCISCGHAGRVVQFFEQNPDDNFTQVVEKYRIRELGEGEAPDDQVDCVVTASDDCPAEVIHVS